MTAEQKRYTYEPGSKPDLIGQSSPGLGVCWTIEHVQLRSGPASISSDEIHTAYLAPPPDPCRTFPS